MSKFELSVVKNMTYIGELYLMMNMISGEFVYSDNLDWSIVEFLNYDKWGFWNSAVKQSMYSKG